MIALLSALPAAAQQSVQGSLDDCIRAEQRDSGLLGSVLGALSGLSVSASRSSGNVPPPEMRPPESRSSSSSGMRVGLGAGVGGAMGLASAYFNAVGDCFEKNPAWIPASRLERGEAYRVASLESGYQAQDGVLALATAVELPASARPETRLAVRSRFLLLTPDGAEATVRIERRLFVLADGVEAALPLPAQASEQRVLPAGEHLDLVQLPIPKEAPLGVSYRLEFSISLPQRPAEASTANASVKVL